LKPHRSDIDGLRALAVLAVVVYHFFPSWGPGGFFGVDVFFVISGYLITLIMVSELRSETFRFSNFFVRRVERLFPALLVVLAASLVFGWFALLAAEYQALGSQVFAGAGFFANFLFLGEAGYFDAAAETKPLLHLWSLGVEGQFYFLWPLILWLAWRANLRLVWLSVLLGCLSFALAVDGVGREPVANFYSPITRFWEFLAGALLSFLVVPNAAVVKYRESRVADAFSVIGVGVLLSSYLLLDSSLPFSGMWALFPVMGSVLIIGSGEMAWANRKILSNRVLVWFGQISFPLYLWHWPIFSFVLIIDSQFPSRNIRIALFVLSIFLAWVTCRWIEPVLRRGIYRKFKFLFLIFSMALVCLAGFYIARHEGLTFRSAVQLAEKQTQDLDFKLARRLGWLCDEPVYQPSECHYTGLHPSGVVVGDSHAPRIYSALRQLYSERGIDLALLASAGGCPPLLDVVSQTRKGPDDRECLSRLTLPLRAIIDDPSLTAVILVSRGPLYTTGKGFGDFRGNNFSDWVLRFDHEAVGQRSNAEIFSVGLDKTLAELLAAGKKVTFLFDVPEVGFNIATCIRHRPFSIHKKFRDPCGLPRADFEARNFAFKQMILPILRKYPSVHVVDLSAALCDENFCYAGKDDVLFYSDDDHLSHRGADYVVDRLRDQFN